MFFVLRSLDISSNIHMLKDKSRSVLLLQNLFFISLSLLFSQIQCYILRKVYIVMNNTTYNLSLKYLEKKFLKIILSI